MNGFQETLKTIGIVRLALTAAVLLGVASGFSYMLSNFSKPEMALLYGDVEMADASKIVQRLENLNVKVELRGGGTQIFVPADKVARMRLEMAEAGLPKSGSMGYEIFDREESLGTSSFVQGINHLRALEGEIARTISSLAQVANARVHLVLPKRKLFSRESEEPSASIMLSLAGPGRLPSTKVAAIQQMVAAAVPGLTPEHVAIVDDRGNLLARADASSDMLATNNLDERKVSYENRLAQTIESLISKYVGDGKVRAEVSVDMDYDSFTENSETFDPEGQVIRSALTVNTGEQEEGSMPSQAVTAASNLPNKGGEAGAKNTSKSSRKEETTNYEITKKIKNYVHGRGAVKRISVAVMVDGSNAKDGAYQPRPETEMKQLTKLIQTAIGYNKDRGDNVEVVNMRFAAIDMGEVNNKPEPMLGLTKQDFMRIGEILIMGILGLLVLLLVVKPLINNLIKGNTNASNINVQNENIAVSGQTLQGLPHAQNQSMAALNAPNAADLGQQFITGTKAQDSGAMTMLSSAAKQDDQMISLKQVEGQVRASSVKTVEELIDSNTDGAVAVVRNWISKAG